MPSYAATGGRSASRRCRKPSTEAGKAALAALLATTSLSLIAAPAKAQPTFTTLQFDGSNFTGVTGIRGDNMTGNYAIPGSAGATGGLLYRFSTGVFEPFPVATASEVNFPGATTSTPYGPSFGAPTGILRVVGSYTSPASAPFNLSYLYDGAAAPGQQITTLAFPNPPGDTTKETIAHSNFGNQVVGNFDTRLISGHAFLYDIPSGAYTKIDKPLALSTTAYGVWANRIAGGFTDPGIGGKTHGYILNESTGVYTTYDAPGAGTVATHFEGISAGGRAGEFNLVADSVDIGGGAHAWAVHVDANGVATWVELKAPGGILTSGNSIYQDTAIGIYVTSNGTTLAYTANVPGLYDPILNTGTLTTSTPGGTAISAVNGDDVVNRGTILAPAANSVGVAGGPYGVITNTGAISATGAGSAAVQMNGPFGSLINAGLLAAAPGAFAIQTGPTAVGTLVVNGGVIDGQVAVAAGPFARFQNSGWMGISAPGSGITHAISGVFAQTSTGTLALRAGANGVSDQLLVNGQARLAGTAQASFQSGALSNSYTLLTAAGGYTGTFDSLSTQNLPGFLNTSLGYNGNTVSLSLQSSMAATAGLGGNQLSVARALDTAFNAGPGLGAMPALFGLSQGQIPSALSILAGDNASVGQSMAFAAGGQFSALMTGRAGTRRAEELAAACARDAATRCDAPPQWGFWASGFGGAQWLNADSSTGSAASQATIGGGAFGGDYRAGPQTLVGAAVGLSGSSYTVAATNANGQATGVHVGLYASHDFQPFYVTSALAYSHFDGNATRVVSGIGNTETEKSSPGASQLVGRVEVGRPFDIGAFQGSQMSVTPFAALQPASLWTPGYQESSVAQNGGTGVFALSYQAQSTASLPSFLGAQLDAQTEINARPLKAWLRAAWVHEFLQSRSVTPGFTVLPGSSFTVDGARAASDAARIDLGARYAIGSQTSLYANGNVELSGRGQSLAGTIGLRITW